MPPYGEEKEGYTGDARRLAARAALILRQQLWAADHVGQSSVHTGTLRARARPAPPVDEAGGEEGQADRGVGLRLTTARAESTKGGR
jgi:hypothetical protein